MQKKELAFIGLGANLGDAVNTLKTAAQAMAALANCSNCHCSPIYRSAPIEAQGPDYFNAVVQLHTCLSAAQLLLALQGIEQQHGRLRPYQNAPRTLDLDLLLYGAHSLQTPTLSVPHPRLHQRAFVLKPLADLAPDLVIPGMGAVASLLVGVTHQYIERA
jgi:2-amino-4-hydroxy-6-hydroxymethyldihydropteridine diphosphokinase